MQRATIRTISVIIAALSAYLLFPDAPARACSSSCECRCQYSYRVDFEGTHGWYGGDTIHRIGTVHVDGERTGWLGTGDCEPSITAELHADELCAERYRKACFDQAVSRVDPRALHTYPPGVSRAIS